jgi:hypothetical protein
MVDEHEAQVRAWLEAEPSLSAQSVLDRLQVHRQAPADHPAGGEGMAR